MVLGTDWEQGEDKVGIIFYTSSSFPHDDSLASTPPASSTSSFSLAAFTSAALTYGAVRILKEGGWQRKRCKLRT